MNRGEPERLGLPGPAGTLWQRTRARLRTAFDELPDGPHEWRIGGGTILAARWGHRKSFDIDITIGKNANLRELLEPAGTQIAALATEQTGQIARAERDPSARLRVTFTQDPALKNCALDISRLEPEPGGRQRHALVDGTSAIVLDTAQILRGKLFRAENSPVRDVFDMTTAQRTDPASAAIAVNCLTRQYANVIAEIWKLSNKRFHEEAETYLEGVEPGFQLDPETLGDQAANGIERALYEHVRIYTERGEGRIEATTSDGYTNRFAITQGSFETDLESCGIDKYLYMNAPGAYAIREEVRAAMEHAEEGDKVVWENTRP